MGTTEVADELPNIWPLFPVTLRLRYPAFFPIFFLPQFSLVDVLSDAAVKAANAPARDACLTGIPKIPGT